MARRVFFSFKYEDVWQVNQIRNVPEVTGTAAAGFHDASLWEEAMKKQDSEIEAMIDEGLKNTSVTLVLVTYGTAGRKWINYEIDQSLARGNGLLAVQIHELKDKDGETKSAGAIPDQIEANSFKAYKYTTMDSLAAWIEDAAQKTGK